MSTKLATPLPAAHGTTSCADPSGSVTRTPDTPWASGSSTTAPGRSGALDEPSRPSSSVVTLPSRMGHATWSGRSLSGSAKANTALGWPSRVPL
ncbi:MAG: hypothetical protein U0667_17105 [Chloroflexota bacterium]